MFTKVEGFQSINHPSEIIGGIYKGICSNYQNMFGQLKVIVREFFRDQEAEPAVCDLLVILPNEDMLFIDFIRMKDGSWRDSFGSISENLANLFPDEIFEQRLVSRIDEASFLVQGNNITQI